MNQTVFKDVRQRARVVYRVKTRSSEYLIGIHEHEGRRCAIVRGAPGTPKEHTIARDSDPRVGGHSLFELPLAEWPGKVLEIATLTTSPIASVVVETDARAIAAVGVDALPVEQQGRSPWARPQPAPAAPPSSPRPGKAWSAPAPGGMPENPRIVPVPVKGTHPAVAATELATQRPQPPGAPTEVDMPAVPAPPIVSPIAPPVHEVQLPYPQRHVGYAESAAALLRSISKRDRLFEDIARDRELKERLRRSLDECALLLEQIRRRDRS